MTDRKQALTNLLEKVEIGSARPYSFHSFFDTPCAKDATNAYLGSLDAAKALHEAVLPGWTVDVCGPTTDDEWIVCVGDAEGYGEHPDNPARAWLIAILKALIEMEGNK